MPRLRPLPHGDRLGQAEQRASAAWTPSAGEVIPNGSGNPPMTDPCAGRSIQLLDATPVPRPRIPLTPCLNDGCVMPLKSVLLRRRRSVLRSRRLSPGTRQIG